MHLWLDHAERWWALSGHGAATDLADSMGANEAERGGKYSSQRCMMVCSDNGKGMAEAMRAASTAVVALCSVKPAA